MESLKKPKTKILNIVGKTSKGIVNLQAAIDVKYLYKLIKTYFEQELLSKPGQLTDQNLQNVLNRRAKDLPTLHKFKFDGDVRVVELAVLLGILETTYRIGGHSTEYTFIPAWQLPNQSLMTKKHFGKESWDGFLVGLPKVIDKDVITLPLELKSLMIKPNIVVQDNQNKQLKGRLRSYKKHFQHSGSINCVLVMPYTNEASLSIDLKEAADDLRPAISTESIGCICVLSFPTTTNGKLALSILFALVSQNPLFMTVANANQWMKEVNFGKVV